ncbi:hypothetical protein J4Q44_G00149840 [Coregonus suidteri]|uniref:Uncharacterized protein n=1 Tax=Coregonus suidteri TaxID=861788 RepID=A0AAN8QT52_9TELE
MRKVDSAGEVPPPLISNEDTQRNVPGIVRSSLPFFLGKYCKPTRWWLTFSPGRASQHGGLAQTDAEQVFSAAGPQPRHGVVLAADWMTGSSGRADTRPPAQRPNPLTDHR